MIDIIQHGCGTSAILSPSVRWLTCISKSDTLNVVRVETHQFVTVCLSDDFSAVHVYIVHFNFVLQFG